MYQVIQPAPEQAEVQVRALTRGSRGGCLQLSVTNHAPDATLVVDWTKVRIRLSNGQARQAMLREQFAELCAEFGAEAYGVAPGQLPGPLPPVETVHPLPPTGFPGNEVQLPLVFGAPADVTGLVLNFESALTWESADGAATLTDPPLCIAVRLPDLSPEQIHPPWWPDWLHVGVVLSNGG
jgi:hypothetical protein